MNYYQFHIADFALHTRHLSLEEEAVYRRLLDYYYDTEQPIPKETDSVIRRLRLGSYAETVALILTDFFVLQADGWHNLRADQEVLDYNEKAERARRNGKSGGRPKKNKGLQKQKPTETQPVISGNPKKTGSKANQEPRTINQEPLTINQKTVNPWPGLKSLDGIDFGKWPSLPTKETMIQWLAVRKSKRATNSQIAMDDICAQITAASADGVSAEDCIRAAVSKSWSGFKADWLRNMDARDSPAKTGQGRHNDFDKRDYSAGVTSDGGF